MKIKLPVLLLILSSFISLSATANQYGYYHAKKQYKITITNITKGVSFTPLLAATHNRDARFFTVGEPASEAVSRIAEGGDIAVLKEELDDSENVFSTANSEGLLAPGASVEITIGGHRRYGRISIPGPACGGSPFSPEDAGEGYVYPSPAIHGEADLTRQAYNWDGAVAKVVIEVVK